MLLKKLHIVKFRGVKNRDFKFRKTNIFCGSNGVGKTTCLDAISMLLCGETFTYDKDSTKNRDMNNQQEQCDISLIVETDSTTFNEEGSLTKIEVVLGCKMYEQYKGKKGEKTEEYIGFKTDWYINERKTTEKEYFSFIKELFNINYNDNIKNFNIFRFLIDYNYTNTCDYKAVKQFIESLLNITSDVDILKDEKFRTIAYDLSSNNFDVKNTNSGYNLKIKELDKEINSTEFVLNDLKNQEKAFDKDLNILSSVEEKRFKIEELKKSSGLTEEEEKEFLQLKEEHEKFNEIKNQLIQARENAMLELKRKGNTCREEYAKVALEKREKTNELDFLIANIKKLEDDKQSYLEIISEREKEKLQILYCPECGCELNKEDLIAFENGKTKSIARCSRSIANINKDVETMLKKKVQLEKELDGIANQVQVLFERNNLSDINEKEEASKITNNYISKLEKVEAEHQENQNRYFELITKIEGFKETKIVIIESLTKQITELELQSKQSETIACKIKDYQLKLDKLLDEKCKIESKQISLTEFKDCKTQLIKENTHKIFGDIVWVLQEESKVNADSKKDKCYATLNGVSMDGVNTASKLVLGSQIISCVKKHLGVIGIPLVFDIVDNIGKTALTKVANLDETQIFCTKADFEDDEPLKLLNLELEKE